MSSAIRQGQFPLHISDSETQQNTTTRYLAVADAFVSSQYILLSGAGFRFDPCRGTLSMLDGCFILGGISSQEHREKK
jgi:hypothetical protein